MKEESNSTDKGKKTKLKESNTSRQIVIVGVGNTLLRDEGIGIHVIRYLKRRSLPENVKLIDAGVCLFDTICSMERIDHLIIVDAAKVNSEPGSVHRFRPEELTNKHRHLSSLHQLSLLDELELLALQGKRPRWITIIGIEPEDVSWGLGLSNRLRNKLPDIAGWVIKEINNNGEHDR